MPMVSIKRFLNTGFGEDTLRQAVAMLIEKLGAFAVLEDDPQQSEAFRKEILGIHEALTSDLPPENVLVLARSATRALDTWNRRIARTIDRQGTDFQVIIKMLQDSLVKIAGETTNSVHGLSRISEELERGTAFKDLQSLKLHLSGCLSELRVEIEREKTASKVLIDKLQTEIGRCKISSRCSGSPRELDPATELPLQQDCMEAIRQAIDAGTRHYIVVMAVNRVQRINARFGREAGDRMLCRFKEHVEHQFFTSDRLFRWSGPALVAILERAESFELVRAQVRRMLESPVEEEYEINGRSVLIPISAAWSVTMLAASADATEKQIQTFIASQSSRDFI
jgi:GGDEF domain-containing protein